LTYTFGFRELRPALSRKMRLHTTLIFPVVVAGCVALPLNVRLSFGRTDICRVPVVGGFELFLSLTPSPFSSWSAWVPNRVFQPLAWGPACPPPGEISLPNALAGFFVFFLLTRVLVCGLPKNLTFPVPYSMTSSGLGCGFALPSGPCVTPDSMKPLASRLVASANISFCR